jgi:hypothetical protein
METKNLQQEKDEQLWKLAKKRVGFRNHFLVYLACNAFFWALWYFTDRKDPESGMPWPILTGISWGFGLLWHFLSAYVFSNKTSSVEKEYERLKRKQQ